MSELLQGPGNSASNCLGDVLCVASIGTIEQAMDKSHGVCVVFFLTEQGQVTLQENF